MKMLSSAVTLMIVYMSALAVNGKHACCVPPKWEGHDGGFIGSNNGGTGHSQTRDYKLSYDSSIEKVAAIGVTRIDGKAYKTQVLMDYKQKTMYTVANGKCYKSPLSAFPGDCVPSSAHKFPDTYFGAGGDTLKIQTYYWNVNSTSVTSTYTKEGVPVSELITSGTKTSGFILVTGYTGVKIGISDPSVFNVPAACLKEEFHEVAEHVVRHMKRKSFLLF